MKKWENCICSFSPIVRGQKQSPKYADLRGLTSLGVVTIDVHVRLGAYARYFKVDFLGVGIVALYRISFRVGYIITTVIIALFLCVGYFQALFLVFYGCMIFGINFSFVVWVPIFSCTTVGWKDFLCLCCCLNRCCWGQVESGSGGKVPRTGGPCRHPMRSRTFAQVEHRV